MALGGSEIYDLSAKCMDFEQFLEDIGPINASQMKSISFRSKDPAGACRFLPAITGLLIDSLPKLSSVAVHIDEISLWRLPSWRISRPHPHGRMNHQPEDSWPMDEAFWPMYRALEVFLVLLPCLKTFKYKGRRIFLMRATMNRSKPWET